MLQNLGHDVLTVQSAGKANLKITDEEVLAFAVSEQRAVLTLNRQDFFRLHRLEPEHFGIIACKDDRERERMAASINQAISTLDTLSGKLIRVKPPQG